MMISHVKIIAFQTITNHSFWTFYIGGKPVIYIINRKIHGCLEIPDNRNKSPHTHVLFSIYSAVMHVDVVHIYGQIFVQNTVISTIWSSCECVKKNRS